MTEYKYLDKINSPEDIKRLSTYEMETLAEEIGFDFAMISYDNETGAAEYTFKKRG